MFEMPYRGATAKDVERAILIPIEEALEGVKGIKQLNADGMRGMARFYLTAQPGADLREMMEDVKARVDTITTFPNETERPRVFIPESGNYFAVLSVAVTGNLGAHDLRKVARRVQEDLLEMPGISRAGLEGGRRFQPILLPSVTTFVGLAPIILDRSLEAQFLIPMAVSMGFGILFTTVITLYLVPCALIFADDLGKRWARFRQWYFRPFRSSEQEQFDLPANP